MDIGMYTIYLFCCSNKEVPIQFFSPKKRIKPGVPPISILISIGDKALSRLIHNAKEYSYIEGIKVSSVEEITQTLFVDDVCFFGKGSITNLMDFASQLDNYEKKKWVW